MTTMQYKCTHCGFPVDSIAVDNATQRMRDHLLDAHGIDDFYEHIEEASG